MNTTILLITVIVLGIFSALLPRTDQKINFVGCVNLVISFFISTYIIYYLFNALDFGFTLTYQQVMFIYLLTGNANLFNQVNRNEEEKKLQDNE